MRDVSSKSNSLRAAKASAILRCAPATISAIRSGRVPKADPIAVARVAGIQAAKNTSLMIPYCHQVPLDFVGVIIELKKNSIVISAEAKAVWKTGVEMEAISAASAAAITLYDMLKIIDDSMEISSIRLDGKQGGKSDFAADEDVKRLRAAVIVLSDSVVRGTRSDRSGKAIVERLKLFGLKKVQYSVLPDEPELLRKRLLDLCSKGNNDLIFTSGGTGLSPRDITPEVTAQIIDKKLDGVSERLRSFGQERNRFAMLSRGIAGVKGRTVIVNLPGALRAVNESMDVLLPWLFHSFSMLRGGGH